MLPRVSLVEAEKAKFLVFSSGDIISQHLFTGGVWEDHLLNISKMFYDAVESPLVLDIGANLGAYSIPIAKDIQDKNGKVMAFEPQRIIFYQLCANVFLNRLENIFPHYMAVDEKSGFVDIPDFDYSKNINNMAFSLDKNSRILHGIEDSNKNIYYKVKSISLDDFYVDRAPALIKIDVEGYELNVLRGTLSFLETHRYPPIIFEAWSFDWFIDGKNELLAYIEKIGYKWFKIDDTNYVAQHPLNSVAIDFKLENNLIHMSRVR